MGNLVSVDVFSGDIALLPQQSSTPIWAICLLAIICVAIGMGLAFLGLYIAKRRPSRLTHSVRFSRQLPTLVVLILLFTLMAPQIECRGHRRGSGHSSHRKLKKTGKYSAGLFASTAAFFGMEQLASYFIDNPDTAIIFLAILGSLVLILLVLFARFLIQMCRHPVPNQSAIATGTSPLTETELIPLRQLASQFVQGVRA